MVNFEGRATLSNQEPQSAAAPAPQITTDSRSGVRFFAGNADDPFFLDDTGANRFVASSIAYPGNPDKSLLGFRQGSDTYSGFNTLITAVSFPTSLLKGKSNIVGINAVMQRRETQKVSSGAVRG